MSKKEDDAYAEWVEETKKSLTDDPERLAAFEKLTAKDDATSREVFRGHLRERKLYQSLNEVDIERKALEADRKAWLKWKSDVERIHTQTVAENKALREVVEKGGYVKAKPDNDDDDSNDDRSPRRTPPNVVTREELQAMLEEQNKQLRYMDVGATAYSREMAKVVKRAISDGFDVDLDKIHERVASENVSAMQAYELETSELRKKKTEEEVQKRIEAEVKKRVAEARSKDTPDGGGGRESVSIPLFNDKPLSKAERLENARRTFSTPLPGVN